MSNGAQFCCTTHHLPTPAPNSHLLTSFLRALSTILERQPPQPPPLARACASHPPPFTTSPHTASSTSIYVSARSQPLPQSSTSVNNETNIKLFPLFPSSLLLPQAIIELEIIQNADRHTRHFSHQYAAELEGRSWHEKQMFPEESFGEVECERVKERWRRGQGYRDGRDKERGSWVGGRVTEWVKRDEVDERGRVGWRCRIHGWGYWARLIKWEDEEDGDMQGGEGVVGQESLQVKEHDEHQWSTF